MRPFIPDGTPVMILPLADRPPRIGEVVLAPRGDGMALHRVVRVLKDGRIVTRGDACAREDPPVAVEDLLGRAVLAIRKGKALPLDGPGMRTLGWMIAVLSTGLYRVLGDRAQSRRS